ncbi:hypothetical protein AB0O47_39395 [Streptomyces noursei]|uniref:hypothetical protein n=1 Tax=Streptomyces noursei TaxID=1971 RepID=UPI00344F4136
MSWRIVPLLHAVRGPQPPDIPCRPALHYVPQPLTRHRTPARDLADVAVFLTGARAGRAAVTAWRNR